MRDPRNALRPFIIKETLAAREKLAEGCFDLEAVRQKITETALRGEGSLRLRTNQITTDLQQTEAAKRLLDWCAQNGMAVEWVAVTIDRPNGLRIRTAELVISWIEESRS